MERRGQEDPAARNARAVTGVGGLGPAGRRISGTRRSHLPMYSALEKHPVAGSMSDRIFNDMAERRPTSPQRRWETFPARNTTLPSREPSKEDIELAQHLLGHSQGARSYKRTQDAVPARDSRSPTHEGPSPTLTRSPSAEHAHLGRPGSSPAESRQREDSQSYAPLPSNSDAVPSGQVCR